MDNSGCGHNVYAVYKLTNQQANSTFYNQLIVRLHMNVDFGQHCHQHGHLDIVASSNTCFARRCYFIEFQAMK